MKNALNKNDIFLKGKNVILKALNEEDVLSTNWYGWFNDGKTTRFMQKHYFPNTQAMQLSFLRDMDQHILSKIQVGICDINTGLMFGIVSIQQIDFINRKAELSIVIGEKKYQTLVYSLEALSLMAVHAFYTLNLRRLYAGVMPKEWANALCKFLNFKQEGVLRQDIFKHGEYCDIYRIAVLESEFKNYIP